jgi:NADPH:quinone reductase-like Zn-dependent oxidoreductase
MDDDGTTMRAVRQEAYGAPEDVLHLGRAPVPTPEDGEVLLKVHAAGVDRGVWHLVTGLPLLVRPVIGLRAPRNPVPGGDVAGRVEAVGAGVTTCAPGDEVYGIAMGSYAEFARARAGKLAPTPAGLTPVQAAAVPVSGLTALQAVRDRGRVEAGQEVLVIGASGGVGTFAVQVAVAVGAVVDGVCSAAKADLVRSLGARDVFDHRTDDPTDGTRRYDVVLDIGGNTPVARLRRALTPTGTLVIVGGEGGGRIGGGMHRMAWAMLRSPFTRQRLGGFVASEKRDDLLALTDLIETGKVTPAVQEALPLAEAGEALRRLAAGEVRGKLVLTV